MSVRDIFVNHSCLAEQMKAAMRDGKVMPEEVKALMRMVKDHAKGQDAILHWHRYHTVVRACI
ncbi:MAG: hypothetical protein PHI31_16205 [Desulfuromonadaceae bacterium]|nr:hypothetical protein [Desulfuromonadaceae bacterium]